LTFVDTSGLMKPILFLFRYDTQPSCVLLCNWNVKNLPSTLNRRAAKDADSESRLQLVYTHSYCVHIT